jgi:hypothetical protein
VGGHLEHNLGLDLRLCVFRLHYIPRAIFYRHEYERRSTEVLHLQARLGQGYHMYISDGSFAKEGWVI